MPDPILASNIPEEAAPTRPLAVVVDNPDVTPVAALVDLDARFEPLVTPVAGVAVDAAGIHAALVTLGFITA